jgi:hypothetical protein
VSGGWFPLSHDGSLRSTGRGLSAHPGAGLGASRASSFGTAAAAAGSDGGGGPDQSWGVRRSAASDGAGASGALGPAVVELLADELLRSKGGRPVAVRHLEDAAGAPGLLPVQLQVGATRTSRGKGRGVRGAHFVTCLGASAPHTCPAAPQQVLTFVRAMAAAPGSPLLASPQLSDFYVHHHFLQFARLYHAALSAQPDEADADGRGSTRAAALRACRGHLEVLLEVAARAPGAGSVRRRFLQLRVLDFCLRELSLEHGMKQRVWVRAAPAGLGRSAGAPSLQVALPRRRWQSRRAHPSASRSNPRAPPQAEAGSRTVSSFSTPASTARQLSSRRASKAGSEAGGGGGGSGGGGGGAPMLAAAAAAVVTGAARGAAEEAQQQPAPGGGSPWSAAARAPAAPPQHSSPASHGSPLKGRRLALSSAGGAAQQPDAECGGALLPRPPEGPLPSGGAGRARRPPAVPPLAPPLRFAPPSPPGSPGVASASGSDSASSDRSSGGSSGGALGSPWSGSATPEPPEPTGDLSEDLAAIEEWEARTGRVYEFQGLSDAEDEAPGSACGGGSPCGPAAGTAAAAPPSARTVPRLALGAPACARVAAAGAPALPPAAELPWGASPPGSPGSGVSSGSSSYRPGYDLEEDFARGYLPPGLDSARSSGASGGDLIPAGRDPGGGGSDAGEGRRPHAGGADEWGSSSGSSRRSSDPGGSGSGGSARSGGDCGGGTPSFTLRDELAACPAGRVAAAIALFTGEESPNKRLGLLPALDLAAKAKPASPGGAAPVQSQALSTPPRLRQQPLRAQGLSPAARRLDLSTPLRLQQREAPGGAAPAAPPPLAAIKAAALAAAAGPGGDRTPLPGAAAEGPGGAAAGAADSALASYRDRRKVGLGRCCGRAGRGCPCLLPSRQAPDVFHPC